MSSYVNWTNPYADRDGQWLKGNLHTHTTPASGCGAITVPDCIDRYIELGYDFVALSDHNTYTEHSDDRIAIIPGIEWNADADHGGHHMGIYSFEPKDLEAAIATGDQDELLGRLGSGEALLILNHPNWQLRPHYRREELEQKSGYDGIEIYNAVIERLHGYAISTDKWDYLLAKGIRVLGFANDDSHCYSDIGIASIHVRSKTRAPRDIVSAIKSGNFYCSSGALIDDIRCEDGVIEIETPDAQEIQVRSYGGLWLDRVRDKSIRFDTRAITYPYVRFTIYGCGSSMAWTQPFFRTAQPEEAPQ